VKLTVGLPPLSVLHFTVMVGDTEDKKLLTQVYIPWALRAGKKAKPLLAVRYESMLEMPVEEVRSRLDFEPAPPLPHT